MGRYVQLQLHRFWDKERGSILGAVEFMSGLTLVLYALSCAWLPPDVLWRSPIRMGFSLLAEPIVWEFVIFGIGTLQMMCSLFKSHPLCHVITSYPATAACFFASFCGMVVGHTVEPLAWFAFAFGVLNLLVVQANMRKVRG